VPDKLEARVAVKMLNIPFGSSKQIVNAEHFVPVSQQKIDKMRAKKSCAASDQDSFSAIVKSWHGRKSFQCVNFSRPHH
jgi:hypothetical protein